VHDSVTSRARSSEIRAADARHHSFPTASSSAMRRGLHRSLRGVALFLGVMQLVMVKP
jgi:hypothetical protein